ncbi:hypothetical protein HN865_03250 [Candidatus Woesearchaeota archaeon]|jgi:hypothetical protein|nr:hypothetical protein [Candidatus Woesearchaeota archaeon]MBT7237849.1 hypothetical protein [Candidatus Woesearchaeota archaeon]
MDNRAEALSVVMNKGPLQPSQIATTVNTNILFASAILSELVDNKKVKITHVKRGGSPFYYVQGQEEKLMDLAKYLSGKTKEAYDILSEKLVVRDSTAEPWQRVALRELKDFAVPVHVNYKGIQETFWKWYLTTNDEAKGIIKELFNEKGEVEKETLVEKPIEEPLKKEIQKEVVQETLVKKESIENGEEILGDYFSSNEMYIISQNVVRKGREFNFVIDVPSRLGKLRYFVKYKNKKSITDKDLLGAFDEGMEKGLPILFLSGGELNKKAQKYMDENISGRLLFKSL